MTEQLRNRIIGGTFLAAVLIICVPMFFDKPLVLEGVEDIPPMPPMKLDEVAAPIHVEPDIRTVEDVVDQVETLVSADGFLQEEGSRVGEPVLSFDAENAKQWAVQIASFGSQSSAEELRDTLETDGHRAWISTAIVDERKVHRVVVGPFIKREDADDEVLQFNERYEMSPIVVGFSY